MACLSFEKSCNRWRVRWHATYKKKVWSGSKTFLEKSQAVAFYADMTYQEKLWRSGTTVQATIKDAEQVFFRSKDLTKATEGIYRYALERFFKSLVGVQTVGQLDSKYISEFIYQMQDAGLTNRTINLRLTAVKSFCRFLSEHYNLPNPATNIKMRKETPSKSRWLSETEFKKVIKTATPLNRSRFLFLASTGLRASEFSKLKVKKGLTQITITGKGRKQRTIPLSKTAQKNICEPCTKNALSLACQRTARRAGIPIFGPHAFRHYFATDLLKKGVPVYHVSKLLGHSSVRTTEKIYAHLLTADLTAAINSLSF
jgi:site-specific recombinase XerD